MKGRAAAGLLLIALASPALAGNVYRCDGGDGNAIYTDKPCAVLRAQPGRMSDDLSLRIAMASTGDYADASQELAVGAYRDAAEPLRATLPATTRRSASAGCARSPQQLSRDLVGAFALHDVNRVAESYHWAGMSQRRALPVMKQLERLSARSLADARFLAAWIDSGDHAAAAAEGTRLKGEPSPAANPRARVCVCVCVCVCARARGVRGLLVTSRMCLRSG